LPLYAHLRRSDPNATRRPTISRRTALLGLALAATTFATTATGDPCDRSTPEGIVGFQQASDGTLLALVSRRSLPTEPTHSVIATSNDGAAWVSTSPVDKAVDFSAQASACDAAGTCWLVTGNGAGGVHETKAGGSPKLVFSFSDDDWDRMAEVTNPGCQLKSKLFTSIGRFSVKGKDVVLVAMGNQGALRRSPSGHWSRVGVSFYSPTSTAWPLWIRVFNYAPWVLAFSGLLFVFAGERNGIRRRAGDASALAFMLALPIGALVFFMGLTVATYVSRAMTSLVLSATAFGASVFVAWQPKREKPEGKQQACDAVDVY
jgi:hypothetical protein